MAQKYVDITGKVFNRLTVLERVGRDKNNHVLWRCRCTCGNETTVRTCALKVGHVKSCGCLSSETAVRLHTKHGHTSRYGKRHSSTYITWMGMVRRTGASATFDERRWYKDIKICKRWLIFENFLADMGERPKGMTIERKNNKRGYSKTNCKWATSSEQARNTRKSVRIKGESLLSLCEKHNHNYNCIKYRLQKGWNLQDALNTPSQRYKT